MFVYQNISEIKNYYFSDGTIHGKRNFWEMSWHLLIQTIYETYYRMTVKEYLVVEFQYTALD